MAYSVDFRKAAIEYWQKGHSEEELYEAFKIYPSRVYKWIKLEEETGSLEPKYPKTRKGKIDLEELERAIERKPDAYLKELAKPFNCSESGVSRALGRLNITVKKSNTHTQSNHQQT